jgi:transglutaminase-like putative cysteine protease
MSKRFTLLCSTSMAIATLLGSNALARWEKPEEAAAKMIKSRHTCDIKEDGTSVCEFENWTLLTKDAARELGTLRLRYNEASTKTKLLLAETINGSKVSRIPKSAITDRAVDSTTKGFDSYRSLTFSFPDIRVGSIIHTKARETTFKTSINGRFSSGVTLGSGLPQEDVEYVFRSVKPLEIAFNDPTDALEIQRSHKGNTHVLSIRSKKLVYFSLTGEQGTWVPKEKKAWFLVSTHKSYTDYFEPIVKEWNVTLSKPLPPNMAAIAARASKVAKTVDQANTVLDGISESFRYMGDWRTVEARFTPHSLARIDEAGYGDCKDLSITTAAILRHLGYRAWPAILFRGSAEYSQAPALANDFYLNHAVVYAEKDGHTFWLDATNEKAFAQGTPPDIDDRMALLIKDDKLVAVRSRAIAMEDAVTSLSYNYSVVPNTTDATIRFDLDLRGISAYGITGALINASKEQFERRLADDISGSGKLGEYTVEPVDLTTRITKDVSIRAQVTSEGYFSHTSAGLGLALPRGPMSHLQTLDTTSAEGNISLGHPDIYLTNSTIERSRLVGKLPETCEVQSDWVGASRTIKQEGSNLIINTRIETRKRHIANSELKSPEFASLVKSLTKCFPSSMLIFEPLQIPVAH